VIKRLTVSALLAATLTVAGASVASAKTPLGWELPAMSVPAAQALSKGEGVTVAVLDTGVRTTHPTLKGRAKEGPDFLRGNDTSKPWYGDHGTSMASSILDVAPRAQVLGLRVIRDYDDPNYKADDGVQGNSRDNPRALSQAIRYAVDHGADVISMSLGSRSTWGGYDTEDLAAIDYALSKGVVVLAAVGNLGDLEQGGDNAISYPGAYPGVITVAASGADGSRAPFSSVHSYIDIAAPGVAINAADSRSDGRKPGEGTSSACALAAGASALIVAKYPDLAPRQVEQVLEKTASHASRGHSAETGYGVINAQRALHAAAELTPEKRVVIGDSGTGMHFGPGDDGTPKTFSQGVDPWYLGLAACGALVAILAMVGGVWLCKSGRRLQRQGLGDGGPGGSTAYPQYGQPIPPQQNPYQQPTPPQGQWPPQQ
jgi:subtilisin family serine protease